MRISSLCALVLPAAVVRAGGLTPVIAGKKHFDLSPLVDARVSNASTHFTPFAARDLFARQNGCVDPGYVPCSNNDGCCPAGETCTRDGCCKYGESQCQETGCYDPSSEICCSDGTSCPTGTVCVGDVKCCPVGQQRCGDYHCYDPATMICCDSGLGACDKDESCCAEQCCYSVATCGADGFCSASTCTATSTYRSTSFYAVHTVTITAIAPPSGEEEAPEFTCPPVTATNSAGDTLELGDDCQLTLSPSAAAATTSSSGGIPAARALVAHQTLGARAGQCLVTSTSVATYTVRAISTVTATVTEQEAEESFSCAPMSVTNSAGDELSLNEECSLEFSPNTDAPTATATGSANRGQRSAAVLGAAIPSWLLSWAVMSLVVCMALV